MWLLEGRAREAHPELAQLSESAPEVPELHYYKAAADLALAPESERPEVLMRNAFDSLERASLTARDRALQDRVGRALNYVRSLTSEKRPEPQPRRSIFEARPGLP